MINNNDIEPEVICDFKVSSQRKKLWISEINMMLILETVSKKYNLDYWLMAGSAIGAVRNNGFIPWDDDIDIGMIRDDFEKLLKVIGNELPEGISYQYGLSERGFDILLRIRDSSTTGICEDEIDRVGNKGAFIEIYPFDFVDNNLLRKFRIALSCIYVKLMDSINKEKAYYGLFGNIKGWVIKLFPRKLLWTLYDLNCRLQDNTEKKYVDTIALPFYAKDNIHLFQYEDVKSSILVPFEYTSVRVPKGFDNCLRNNFGDYMKLPPVSQRGNHHNAAVFYDPTKPYTYYETQDGRKIIKSYFDGKYELQDI